MPGPCPLGDSISSLPHLQRQFAPGQARFGTTGSQRHVSRLRQAFRARQGGSEPGSWMIRANEMGAWMGP